MNVACTVFVRYVSQRYQSARSGGPDGRAQGRRPGCVSQRCMTQAADSYMTRSPSTMSGNATVRAQAGELGRLARPAVAADADEPVVRPDLLKHEVRRHRRGARHVVQVDHTAAYHLAATRGRLELAAVVDLDHGPPFGVELDHAGVAQHLVGLDQAGTLRRFDTGADARVRGRGSSGTSGVRRRDSSAGARRGR